MRGYDMTATMDATTVAVIVCLLGLIALAITTLLRLEKPWLQAWSLFRAVVQLGALALVLRFAIERTDLVLVFLGVMVVAAAALVVRRLEWGPRRAVPTAGVIALSAALPGAVVFASGAVPLEARYLLALGGMIIGGVMTVSTLFGRALREALPSCPRRTRRGSRAS